MKLAVGTCVDQKISKAIAWKHRPTASFAAKCKRLPPSGCWVQPVAKSLRLEVKGSSSLLPHNIGALIIRIASWGALNYNYNKETPE